MLIIFLNDFVVIRDTLLAFSFITTYQVEGCFDVSVPFHRFSNRA